MPELPDVAAYITALDSRIVGQPLVRATIVNPFVLRTQEPRITDLQGRTVRELRRIGKRIAIGFDEGYWLVIHLMIAGRLRWNPEGAGARNRATLAFLDFPDGTLVLTEAGSKRRASLRVVKGEANLAELDPGGIDPLESDFESFRSALAMENRTLKRALTDPRILGGVGNAYSDEILHAAKLSPVSLTQRLDEAQWQRLYEATRGTLRIWIDRLQDEARREFPKHVTAFRKEMAVHSRYGKACPTCGEPVQRIRYADNETNYCARCQTGGRLLADRSLSRLLKSDWPRTLEELETLRRSRG